MSPFDPSAEVSSAATVHPSAHVWGLAQVREGARIGAQCIVSRGVYIGSGVTIGDRVKIQNFAQIYEPAIIEDGVFIGPAVVLTNDLYPRAVTPDGRLATAKDWRPAGVTVRQGASIGARAVCVAPVVVGCWAMIAAGATVVRDVPDFALVAGTPARQIGWVGRAGHRLLDQGGRWRCPVTGANYVESNGILTEVDDA
jgi:UDP-2-acetamido-3-amino-2,3-dideoxy-glucuronate N-acetyltransferase